MSPDTAPDTDGLQYVRCPSCGRLIIKVGKTKGVTTLEYKCSRCKSFIHIVLSQEPDKPLKIESVLTGK